jgi:exopolyphosphatase/guanosine-5'-triphosphate,3'-diphosphate pyrophosphatase
MKKFASIDIGSQTIRLLVAGVGPAAPLQPVYRDRAIIRLGEGMQGKKVLQPQPMERAVDCVASFIKKARDFGAAEIFPVCTACVRNAENAAAFLQRVLNASGIMPRVLSGDEEARLSMTGVLSALPAGAGRMLIIDIGGGSTEAILLHNAFVQETESFGLGVIGLAEKHLLHDPPLPAEIASLHDAIDFLLQSSRVLQFVQKAGCRLAGTAGTITTLAAMALQMTDYDPEKINGCTLNRHTIASLFDTLIKLPLCERQHIAGLENGRAVVIIPGAAAVLAIMQTVHAETILVSDAGLLEGVLIEKIKSSAEC